MRVIWFFGCASSANLAACYGSGAYAQNIFGPNFLWVWYLIAAYWSIAAIKTALGGGK